MPWFIPTVLVSGLLFSAFFYGKALKHLTEGSNPLTTALLGTLASSERFTPTGRRYRMWSLAFGLGGVLLAALLIAIWLNS